MARTRLRVTQWNAERLLGRSTQILEDFAPVIAEAARDQLTAVKWTWPNPTVRFRSLYQPGTTVRTKFGTGVLIPKGKRDIVDTGFLLASQQAPKVAGNSLSIVWTAPYAAEVLRGSYPDPRFSPVTRKQLPPAGKKPERNWIRGALLAEPLLPFFVRRWRELADGPGPSQRR
jgi:hypothetical protein